MHPIDSIVKMLLKRSEVIENKETRRSRKAATEKKISDPDRKMELLNPINNS